MKVYVAISFNKSLPDNEGFSLSKVIDESVNTLKLKKHSHLKYKVISRHRNNLKNNKYYNYINADDYYIKILSIVIKFVSSRSILKRYFDSSSRNNIAYTLALVIFIFFNVKKTDIILFHGSYKVLLLFSKIFRDYNFIYYRHGGSMLNISKNDLNDIITFCRGRIIHVSKTTFNQVENAQKKSTIIYNGLDDRIFKKNRLNKKNIRNQIRTKHKIHKNDLVFFIGGLIWISKGYHHAINALSKFKKEPFVLFIAGDLENADKSYVCELRNLSKEKNVKTIFLGRLNHKLLYEYMLSSDVGLQLTDPKKYKEGISIILLEMMFLGLPVICSNSGGNSEIVKDNYSGLIIKDNDIEVQLEDAIDILKDKLVRKQIGINGLNTVKKDFSSEKMTREIMNYLHFISKNN